MATFRKYQAEDGTISYTARVRRKGFPEETRTFRRLTDARDWARGIEDAMKDRRFFRSRESQKHSLQDLVDRYKTDVLEPKGQDREGRGRQLDWWAKHLGTYALVDVTPALIAEYRDRIQREDIGKGGKQRKRTPSTVVRYMAALSHAFSVAMREYGWVEDNPVRKVSRPREPNGRARFLSDQERERLLEACDESRFPYIRPIVLMALSTGMRHGEILNLNWSDVDLKTGWITLHNTKNRERRGVPLAGKALRVLRAWAKVRRMDTELVFPNADGTGPVSTLQAWRKLQSAAKLQDFRFHDLRHSAASYLLMNGASLVEIADILGHKTLSMVRRYSHLTDEHKRSVVERMNQQYLR